MAARTLLVTPKLSTGAPSLINRAGRAARVVPMAHSVCLRPKVSSSVRFSAHQLRHGSTRVILASNGNNRRTTGVSTMTTCKAAAAGQTDWSREVSTALIRVVAGVIMIHNGLDKLQDPEGFAKFVVEPHLGFLPEPLIWTYLAAGAELVGAAGLTLGLFTRLCSFSLFSTMGLAVLFHINDTGLEGFPLAVVEKHQYAYEAALLYCLIYFYFLVNGGGVLSIDNAISGDD